MNRTESVGMSMGQGMLETWESINCVLNRLSSAPLLNLSYRAQARRRGQEPSKRASLSLDDGFIMCFL